MSVSIETQKCEIILTSPLPSTGLDLGTVFTDLGTETILADYQSPILSIITRTKLVLFFLCIRA